MSRLKTSSYLDADGVKCWNIVDREGKLTPIKAVPSSSNKQKYVVTPEDRPMSLKQIKERMLNGEYAFFADSASESDLVEDVAAALFDDKPTTRDTWDCASPAALLVLVLSGDFVDDRVLHETLDAHGYLSDLEEMDQETARAVYYHHLQRHIERDNEK